MRTFQIDGRQFTRLLENLQKGGETIVSAFFHPFFFHQTQQLAEVELFLLSVRKRNVLESASSTAFRLRMSHINIHQS